MSGVNIRVVSVLKLRNGDKVGKAVFSETLAILLYHLNQWRVQSVVDGVSVLVVGSRSKRGSD